MKSEGNSEVIDGICYNLFIPDQLKITQPTDGFSLRSYTTEVTHHRWRLKGLRQQEPKKTRRKDLYETKNALPQWSKDNVHWTTGDSGGDLQLRTQSCYTYFGYYYYRSELT